MQKGKDRFDSIPLLGPLEDVIDIGKDLITGQDVKQSLKENAPDIVSTGVNLMTMNIMGGQSSGTSLGGSAGRTLGALMDGGIEGAKQQAKAEAVGFLPDLIEGAGAAAAAYTGTPLLADVGRGAAAFVSAAMPEVQGYNPGSSVTTGQRVIGTATIPRNPDGSVMRVDDGLTLLRDYSQQERESLQAGAEYATQRAMAFATVRNLLGLQTDAQVRSIISAIHFILEDQFGTDL